MSSALQALVSAASAVQNKEYTELELEQFKVAQLVSQKAALEVSQSVCAVCGWGSVCVCVSKDQTLQVAVCVVGPAHAPPFQWLVAMGMLVWGATRNVPTALHVN
jgi:hypothetical protein